MSNNDYDTDAIKAFVGISPQSKIVVCKGHATITEGYSLLITQDQSGIVFRAPLSLTPARKHIRIIILTIGICLDRLINSMVSNYMPDSFFIHSGTEIVYANSTFCTFMGIDSQTALVGTSLMDVVTADYQTPLREQISAIENGETPARGLTLELDTVTDRSRSVIAVSTMIEWDGSQHVQTSVFPVAGGDTSPAQILHGQKIDEAPIGITVADPSQPDNPIIQVNDGFCELTGYEREEILGRNCRFLQGEATREEPVAKMREAIAAEDPVTVELRNYRKDGSMFWNRVTIIPIRSNSGTVTYYFGYQQDISSEKRYEQDLSVFKAHAEESEKAILITDAAGTIQYVNPAFERINGYTAAEAIGQVPRILKSGTHEEEFYAELWETITAGEVWEGELVNKTKYGELYEAKQTIIPVMDPEGEISHFVGVTENITENVLTTQALGVLNRVMRHNLRNAVNAIDLHAEMLEDEELAPKTRQASVAAIRNQAASMQKIAEKTAEIRSIWDPAESLDMWAQLDIASLVEPYQRQYPDAEITCRIEWEDTIQIRDAELFKNAMDEAVTNAIEHSEQSPPEVTITVQRDADADQFHLSVADNGPGIPELERQALEASGETPLIHSLGVGLWVMEWITTTLGGELTISDNVPRGSVVTFQLPLGGSVDK